MTQQEILESNRLIADFMELNIQPYNIDWRILMPVVEKIESIKDEYHGRFGVSIYSNSCAIQSIKI